MLDILEQISYSVLLDREIANGLPNLQHAIKEIRKRSQWIAAVSLQHM